jgi:hypothetical protein
MAFKDLVTAAFGTGTTATTSTSTLPASVDDHPQWVQHQRQRDALAATLAAATADVGRLQRERAQMDRDGHEADVQRLLGDDAATVTPEADRQRMLAADAAIATAQARVATITEALTRLDARGVELRNTLVWEMRATVETRAIEIVRALAQTLRDASKLNDELAILERFERYESVAVPVRHLHELSGINEYSRVRQWLAAAAPILEER